MGEGKNGYIGVTCRRKTVMQEEFRSCQKPQLYVRDGAAEIKISTFSDLQKE